MAARSRTTCLLYTSSKADSEAAHKADNGELPQWTSAEVEEAFRRFAAANPNPRGELQYICLLYTSRCV